MTNLNTAIKLLKDAEYSAWHDRVEESYNLIEKAVIRLLHMGISYDEIHVIMEDTIGAKCDVPLIESELGWWGT